MSSTLENILSIEVEDTLNWIEEMEEMGHVDLKCIQWKGYTFTQTDEGIFTESGEGVVSSYDDWEEALNTVKEKTIVKVMKQIEERKKSESERDDHDV